MFSDRMQAALNDQINFELSAYYTYLSMSGFFEHEGLTGFAQWMRHHASEEMMHTMKIYDFINERRGRVVLKALDAPPAHWDSTIGVFEDALRHEQKVTAAINSLVDLAREEHDHATNSFLQWFVDEQVEEEAVVSAVIDDLKRVADFGPGLFLLNRELGSSAAADNGEAES